VPGPTTPLLGFVLGVAFAWAAADELARAGGVGTTSRSMVVVTLFSLLVFSPIAAYFLAFAPDWSYAYVVDPQRLPGAVDLGLVLLDVASVPAGFALAARRAGQRRLGPLVKLAAAPAIGALLILVAGFQRLAVQGTFAQFHGDFGTRSVAGSPLGYSLLWMAAVLAGGILWTARSLRRISSS